MWARKLRVPTPSLTFPVSSSITTEQVSFREICVTFTVCFYQVIEEALARFRLEGEPTDKYQLVKVTLESGRGVELMWKILNSIYFICSD